MSKISRHTKGSQLARRALFAVVLGALTTLAVKAVTYWLIGVTWFGFLFLLGWNVTLSALIFNSDLVGPFVKSIVFPIRTSQGSDKITEPPIIPEFLVGLFVKRRYRNGLLQNLEDDFESNLAAGATVRRARRKYWSAALHSIGPQLFAAAKRIGIIGLIADYARRLLH
ncbi:MAG: hypothetical protein M3178_02620 [Pseudomonadota bacterium]|nr:hypothetical protein [Pseudomonadota bacterium]